MLILIGNEMCGAFQDGIADVKLIRVEAFDRTANQVPLESERLLRSTRAESKAMNPSLSCVTHFFQASSKTVERIS